MMNEPEPHRPQADAGALEPFVTAAADLNAGERFQALYSAPAACAGDVWISFAIRHRPTGPRGLAGALGTIGTIGTISTIGSETRHRQAAAAGPERTSPLPDNAYATDVSSLPAQTPGALSSECRAKRPPAGGGAAIHDPPSPAGGRLQRSITGKARAHEYMSSVPTGYD